MLTQAFQHPGEHLVVNFQRHAAPGPAQPRAIRHALALAKAKELAQPQAVGPVPFQSTLAVDAFEVADQQHAKIAPRRQRWSATTRRILRCNPLLHEPVKLRCDQHGLQLIVEDVPRRPWHLRPRYQHIRLPCPLPSKCRRPPASLPDRWNQIAADFVNGLLGQTMGRIDPTALYTTIFASGISFCTKVNAFVLRTKPYISPHDILLKFVPTRTSTNDDIAMTRRLELVQPIREL